MYKNQSFLDINNLLSKKELEKLSHSQYLQIRKKGKNKLNRGSESFLQ